MITSILELPSCHYSPYHTYDMYGSSDCVAISALFVLLFYYNFVSLFVLVFVMFYIYIFYWGGGGCKRIRGQ